MKAVKIPKNLKEMPNPPQRKVFFFKKKEIVLHQQKQIPQFHKLFQKAQN